MSKIPTDKIKESTKNPLFWLIFVLLIITGNIPFILIGIGIIAYTLFSQSTINSNAYTMNKQKIIDVGTSKIKKMVSAILIAVILITIFANTIIVIPAGMTGVYHLFGKVKDDELSSGIHVINPFAHITQMDIRTQEYTMSISTNEGNRLGNDSIDALTKEGLTVALDITVLYKLNEEAASSVFKNLGENYQEKIIRPQIRTSIREIIALYNARDIYSEKRTEAQDEILADLKENIEPRGIEIESVLLRNVSLPEKLSNSIQEKLTAEQDAQRYDFILEKEEKEAQRKRLEAEGQRDAQRIINESLTQQYLYYLYVNELKERPGTIYVPISGTTGLPVFKGIE